MPEQARPNNRKTATGIVISNKSQKTIVVRIERRMAHPVYKKVMTKASKFKVHDEKNEAQVGDKVVIMSTRPISKDKHWMLVKVLK